jgi:choline dehydrogenase-like flavoprotein
MYMVTNYTDGSKDGGIDVVHTVGTCRMGADAATSVTDVHGKIGDLDDVRIDVVGLPPSCV